MVLFKSHLTVILTKLNKNDLFCSLYAACFVIPSCLQSKISEKQERAQLAQMTLFPRQNNYALRK